MFAGKLRNVFILITLTFLLAGARLYTLWPTFNDSYAESFRIGITPINDGADWVERAQSILEGRKTLYRPLFSAFLTIPIFIFGINLPCLVSLMLLINVAAIILAWYILKEDLHAPFIIVFLALISTWRMSYLGDMMTENLAVTIFIVAFALIIRGLSAKKFHLLACGYLLVGFGQAVRPWDVMTMATISLFPVAYLGFRKKAALLSFILFMYALLGFSFNFTVSQSFSTSDQDKIDRAVYFYGQVCGGRGCNWWIFDREIKDATLRNAKGEVSGGYVANLIYKRAFKELKKNPMNFLNGELNSFIMFLKNIPIVYAGNKIYFPWFLVFLSAFFVIDRLWQRGPAVPDIAPASPDRYFYKRHALFILLYGAGIFLSVLTIGAVGVDRMWLSLEIFSYYLISLTVSIPFPRGRNGAGITAGRDFLIDKRLLALSGGALASGLIILFLAIPFVLQKAYHRYPEIRDAVTSDSIQKALSLREPVVSQEELILDIIRWPEPTFETLNGSWAYWKTVYRPMKALYLDTRQGLYDRKWQFSKWHLMPMDFPRVAFDDRNPIIFPYTDMKKLERFNNRSIVVVGQVIGRKRLFFTHQGFMILARYIGYPDSNGHLQWIAVRDL